MGERDWDVLLIGGASGTGKSSVGYRLAQHLGVGITEIDDLHASLLGMTTPAQLPMVHYWRTHPEVEALEAGQIFALFLAVSRAMAPAIQAVVEQHLDSRVPIVLEGDYLLPETVVAHPRVRTVFLYEPDEAQLLANYAAREPDGGVQAKRARGSWLQGEWLREECGRLDIPALPARPWETVLGRILALVGP
jgi:2-phosphoglycerate kinase